MLKLACDRQGDNKTLAAFPSLAREMSILTGQSADEELLSSANSLLRALAEQPDFGARDIMFNPAWQLLLELFVAQMQDRPVPVTNACLLLGTAQTTALRYLMDMERRELIASLPDPVDGRRRLIRLTPRVEAELRRYLQHATDEQAPGLRIRVLVPGPGREAAGTRAGDMQHGAGACEATHTARLNSSANGSIQVRT